MTPGSQNASADPSSGQPQPGVSWHWLTRWRFPPEPELETLNRALVAGLMLEAMLENPRLAEEPGAKGQRLKACLRTTLASHLAGRMPLASFQSLAQGLDHWFEVMYPLLSHAGLAGLHPSPARPPTAVETCLIREDLLSECLEKTPGLLPRRRHRKFDREKLQHFLETTGGQWFRLRDFEEHFHMDRKTAWEYVQKLLQAGILVHNQGQSSAVRYQAAPRFLKAAWPSPAKNSPNPAVSSPPLCL